MSAAVMTGSPLASLTCVFAGMPEFHLEKLEQWPQPVVVSRCSAWTAARFTTGVSPDIRSSGNSRSCAKAPCVALKEVLDVPRRTGGIWAGGGGAVGRRRRVCRARLVRRGRGGWGSPWVGYGRRVLLAFMIALPRSWNVRRIGWVIRARPRASTGAVERQACRPRSRAIGPSSANRARCTGKGGRVTRIS